MTDPVPPTMSVSHSRRYLRENSGLAVPALSQKSEVGQPRLAEGELPAARQRHRAAEFNRPQGVVRRHQHFAAQDQRLRRPLLPNVGVLPRRLRGRLPVHEPDGFPDPDRPPTGRRDALHAGLCRSLAAILNGIRRFASDRPKPFAQAVSAAVVPTFQAILSTPQQYWWQKKLELLSIAGVREWRGALQRLSAAANTSVEERGRRAAQRLVVARV
jgi:hypothetical protein